MSLFLPDAPQDEVVLDERCPCGAPRVRVGSAIRCSSRRPACPTSVQMDPVTMSDVFRVPREGVYVARQGTNWEAYGAN